MTVVGEDENSIGVTGFTLKVWGGTILATYWTILFFSSFIQSDAPNSISLDGLIDDLILAMRIHLFVHALSFSLIVVGWITENKVLWRKRLMREPNWSK